MATATKTKKATKAKKAKVNPGNARSELVKAILTNLDRRSWVSRDTLLEKCGHLITKKDAIEVYEYRIGLDEPQRTQVERGRRTQIMLTCITLVQHGKIEQRGRGATKEYRLL